LGLGAFILRRLGLAVPTLVGVALVTFLVSHVVPADPLAIILKNRALASPEIVESYRVRYGLDRSLPEQFLVYLSGLVHGDLGTSFITRQPVAADLAAYLPATIELALTAMLIAIVVGVPLGTLAAIRHGGWIDHLARLLSTIGAAVPAFWLGLVLLFVLYYRLGLLPGPGRIDAVLVEPPRATGMILVDSALAGDWTAFRSGLHHMILPAIVLAGYPLAMLARLTRASLLEALSTDYVRTARAKGLSEQRVVGQHALRNALIPTVTAAGLAFGYLLAGAVTVEVVFSWPGIGRYAVNAASSLDYPAILGITLVVAVVFVVTNLLVDIVYGLLDPRIRAG
jgi:peptide/nickel transport system permease protein